MLPRHWLILIVLIKLESQRKEENQDNLRGKPDRHLFNLGVLFNTARKPLKSVKSGLVDLCYFLLYKVNRFVNEGNNIMVCL